MKITGVQIQLSSHVQDRLRAFCNIIIDQAFVIRDIKIIDGPQGVFVAMPSRKIMASCPTCRTKNHRMANFCNQCGGALPRNVEPGHATVKLHSDVAHPINAPCRLMVQDAILTAYRQETENAKRPGYVPQHIDETADSWTPPQSISPTV